MLRADLPGPRPEGPAWRHWLPPLFLSLAILVLSGDLGAGHQTFGLLSWILSAWFPLSAEALELVHAVLRKAGHFLAYGVLAVLWFRALSFYRPERLKGNVLLALGLSLLVALTDEGHQFLVASRSGSLTDVLLDMAGAVSLVSLAFLYRVVSGKSPAAPW